MSTEKTPMEKAIEASVARGEAARDARGRGGREPTKCAICGRKALYKLGKKGFCSRHRDDARKVARATFGENREDRN